MFTSKGSKPHSFEHAQSSPKCDDLRILAANTKVAVIGITESWLDASVTDSKIDIADYTIIRVTEIVRAVVFVFTYEVTLFLN